MNETYKLPFTASEIEDKLTNGCGLELIGTISLPRDGWEEIIVLDTIEYYRLLCTKAEYELFKNATIIKQNIISDYLYRCGVYEPAFCLVNEYTGALSPMYNGYYPSLYNFGFAVARATYEDYPEANDYYLCMEPSHYVDTVCPDYSMRTEYTFEFYR